MDALAILTGGMVYVELSGEARDIEVREPPNMITSLELRPSIDEIDPREDVPVVQEAETLHPHITHSEDRDDVAPPDIVDATDMRPVITRVF